MDFINKQKAWRKRTFPRYRAHVIGKGTTVQTGRKSLEDGKIILKQKVEKIAQNTKSTFCKGIKFHNIHHKLQLNLSGTNAELKIWFSN